MKSSPIARFRLWVGHLHVGQLLMLLIVYLVLLLVFVVRVAVAASESADARHDLGEATDYSDYYRRGHSARSNSELWELKRRESFSEAVATVYVAGRPRFEVPEVLRDSARQALQDLRVSVDTAEATRAMALAGMIAMFVMIWSTLWFWFEARKRGRYAEPRHD